MEGDPKKNEDQTLGNIIGFLRDTANPGDAAATFGKYTLIKELGHGGSSKVIKAFDNTLKRYVALKLLRTPSLGMRRRFQREAEIIATLKHPNIVPVYEVSPESGINYIAMEYIDGETLDILAPEMEIAEILRSFIKVCDALEHAHSKGVIHRDIKPQNIIIDKDTGVHLVDFGIAKEQESMLTKTDEIMGTPEFMAPEQVNGEPTDARTDIFCLGASLYFSLTNTPPFTGNTPIETVSNVLEKEITPPGNLNPSIPAELASIISKCLEKKPEHRYQDIRQLKSHLEKSLNNMPVNIKGIPPTLRIARAIRSKRKQLLTAAVILAVITISIYLARPSPEERRSAATPVYDKAISQLKSIRGSRTDAIRNNMFGLLKDTVKLFTETITIDPTFSDAYLGRGGALSLMTDYKSALKDFSKAVELNPGSTEAYYQRIICHARMLVYTSVKQRDQQVRNALIQSMKDDLEVIKELDAAPSKIMCAEVIIGMNEQGYDYNLLNDKIKDAIELDPGMEEAHYFSATLNKMASMAASSPQEARQYAQRALDDISNAIEIAPNIAEYYLLSSRISSRILQEYDKALSYLAEAKKVMPSGLWIYLEEASIYIMKNDPDKALEALRRTEGNENKIANTEYRVDFFLERGTLKLALGMDALAEEDFNRAVKMSSDDVKDRMKGEIKRLKKHYSK